MTELTTVAEGDYKAELGEITTLEVTAVPQINPMEGMVSMLNESALLAEGLRLSAFTTTGRCGA